MVRGAWLTAFQYLVDLIGGDDHRPPKPVAGADTARFLAQRAFGDDQPSSGQQFDPFAGRPAVFENGGKSSHRTGSGGAIGGRWRAWCHRRHLRLPDGIDEMIRDEILDRRLGK